MSLFTFLVKRLIQRNIPPDFTIITVKKDLSCMGFNELYKHIATVFASVTLYQELMFKDPKTKEGRRDCCCQDRSQNGGPGKEVAKAQRNNTAAKTQCANQEVSETEIMIEFNFHNCPVHCKFKAHT